jgi:hypothetical protein
MPLFDLVTVVFSQEIELLALQAKSIRLFGDRLSINRIVVIANGADQDGTSARVRSEVLPLYGGRRRQVEVIPGRRLMSLSEMTAGWHTQQVLKLAIAAHMEANQYVSLDAKNHLIRHADDAIFFAPDGRARYQPICYRDCMAATMPHFFKCAEICRIDAEAHIDRALPSYTPILLHRRHVLGLHDFLREHHRTSLERLLCQEFLNVTEYRLYYCYLCRLGVFRDLYTPGRSAVVTLWPRHVENDALFRQAMDEVETNEVPFFSVHRSVRHSLTQRQSRRIAQLWLRAGLIGTESEAGYYLARASETALTEGL